MSLTHSNERAAHTHFAKRCLDYGITSWDGDELKKMIEREPRFSDPIPVRVAKGVTTRVFLIEEGYFYAIVHDKTNICMTLYTQPMINRLKKRNKRHKKMRSRVAAKNLRASKPWRD